jgi:cytidylate kinase
MPARVVCISRTDGALGEEIGNLVAERMGFRYVDEEVIERAARLADVDPKLIAAVEQRQPLIRALMEKLATARDLVRPANLGAGLSALVASQEREPRMAPEDLRSLIQAAIREIALDGRAVIVAHGASMILAIRGDVLRVSVTASAAVRARRLADAEGMTEEQAAVAIATSDRNRRDYFRRFYEIGEELPTHYDVVINTDVFPPEHAAEVIAFAARILRVPVSELKREA